jgi:hypothetical protein
VKNSLKKLKNEGPLILKNILIEKFIHEVLLRDTIFHQRVGEIFEVVEWLEVPHMEVDFIFVRVGVVLLWGLEDVLLHI